MSDRNAGPAQGKGDWMTSAEASEFTGLAVGTLHDLAKRGKLECRQARPGKQGSRHYYSGRSVVALCKERDKADERRAQSSILQKKYVERWPQFFGRHGPLAVGPWGPDWGNDCVDMTTAARMLGTSPTNVARLIRSGRLPSWQESPGLKGSPHFIPVYFIARMQQDRERAFWRAAWERRRPDGSKGMSDWVAEDFIIEGSGWFDKTPAVLKRYAWGLTVRQTGQRLGVGCNRVHHLIKAGRLAAVRSPNSKGGPRAWLFVTEESLAALEADPAYQRRRAAYAAYRARKANPPLPDPDLIVVSTRPVEPVYFVP